MLQEMTKIYSKHNQNASPPGVFAPRPPIGVSPLVAKWGTSVHRHPLPFLFCQTGYGPIG